MQVLGDFGAGHIIKLQLCGDYSMRIGINQNHKLLTLNAMNYLVKLVIQHCGG